MRNYFAVVVRWIGCRIILATVERLGVHRVVVMCWWSAYRFSL